MRFRGLVSVVLLLVVGLLYAPSLMAQEQRGAIDGIVKDSSGAVLPGVTVEVKNVNVGSTATSVTDAQGVYRFPSLAPGKYDVTANLSGFATKKYEAVEVLLGQLKKVDFALSIAGVTETVQVSAETPLVDVRQSARATSIRAEQIDLLPKGRDFTSVVTQAAGANNETKSGGIMIDGASAGENRYIVDGAETTNIQSGASGKTVLADFVEEVQVKSSGYTAEYGGATGGVISVITKSGTNMWRGNMLFNYEGSAIAGERRPTLRLKLANSNEAEYINYATDDYVRYEPGGSIGGPIWKDKTWFYVAYQPTSVKYERSVVSTAAGNPTVNTTRKEPKQYLSANNTAQLGSNLRTRVAYNNSWSKEDGVLAALTGTDPLGTNYASGTKYPNYSVGAQVDWVAARTFYVGARVGYYKSDRNSFGVPKDYRYIFNTTNIGFLDVPTSLQRATGFNNIPTNISTSYDIQKRLAFQVDGTYYGSFAGQHTIKGGVQVDRLGNDVLTGRQANNVTLYWGRTFANQAGKYGYYAVQSNGVKPKMGIITEGNVATNNYGLFVQDAWVVNNKLTINLGLRTENEKVPAYSAGPDIPTYGIEFPFKDKLAPRVGFAYDLNGDGKWKAYGSWGIFYDIFKMELPRGSFGGDKWWNYFYTLDTYNWQTLVDGASCPPACPGTLISGPVDMRHPSFGSDAIEPNLKPMKSQEASFGLEHQLSNVTAVSARYVRKWLNRAIDDTGSLDADNNEIYIIANPGEGLTEYAYPGVKLPKPERVYNGVEFAFTKNLAHNWYLRTSYLWSSNKGNYSGLSQSDENGRMSPNVGRLYDYPTMSFDEKGNPVSGPLATDRPHQVKAQFIYTFPFGASLGINQYVASGIPRTRSMGAGPQSSAYPLFYKGRGSDGRMPTYSQTDLSVQQEFKLGGARRIQVSLNVLNLFNQKIGTNYFESILAGGYAIAFNEADFYAHKLQPFDTLAAGIPKDPRFMMSNAFQDAIQARVGVKFLF